MKNLKSIFLLLIVAIAGVVVSSCNDDKETDRFMVRYSVTVPAGVSDVTAKYINYVAGDAKLDTVEHINKNWSCEIGPVFRGFEAGIFAGNQNINCDVTIEVSTNGGMYQTKIKGQSPKRYKIE